MRTSRVCSLLVPAAAIAPAQTVSSEFNEVLDTLGDGVTCAAFKPINPAGKVLDYAQHRLGVLVVR